MENVRWCGRRLLDGHAGSAIKVLVAIHYSVLDARNGYIRNNNNNSHDNVYGAVIMTKVIARVHPVHLMNVY